MTNAHQPDSLTTHWMGHVKHWQNSGQSQAGYCKSHELSYHQFIYWRRKFEEQAQGLRPGVSTSTGFAGVVYQRSESGLSLALPNGCVMRGISADNLTLVEALLDRLS